MTGELGGVYLAIVDSNKLDERGRIGITIPHSERAGSYPAHIASFMAGDQRGALFLPEINDQVLVHGRRAGDHRQPLEQRGQTA